MKTETKLASMRGALQKIVPPSVRQSARRLIDIKAERHVSRPLRDIDEWSDQSEVAYYEEMRAARA